MIWIGDVRLFRFRREYPRVPGRDGDWPVYVLTSDGYLSAPFKSAGAGWTPAETGREWQRELRHTEGGYADAYQQSAWAFRCVNIRANAIGDLLSKAVVVDRQTGEPQPDHILMQAIRQHYVRFGADFYRLYSYYLDLFGEVYIELLRPAAMPWAYPVGLRILPSLAVEPDIWHGEIRRFLYHGEDARLTVLEPHAVAYDHTFNPTDTLRGLSLMAIALQAVNVDMYVVQFQKNFFKNGARVGLVFAPKQGHIFSDQDYKRLQEWLRERIKGVANMHRPMLLNMPMDVTALDQQSLEDQTYTSKEAGARIAAAFDVPYGLVDHRENAYQLSPEQQRLFYRNTVLPAVQAKIRFIDERIRPAFDPAGRYQFQLPAHEIDQLLTDPKDTLEATRMKLEAGLIMLNEARAAIGAPLFANGNVLLVPPGRVAVPVTKQPDGTLVLGTLEQPDSLPPPDTDAMALHQESAEQIPVLASPEAMSGSAEPVKHADAVQELRAWRTKALNKGVRKALTFVCYQIPPDVQAVVRAGLTALDFDDDDGIRAVFERAYDRLTSIEAHVVPPTPGSYEAGKAIQSTRLEFEMAVEDLMSAVTRERLDRRRFASSLRALLRLFGEKAFRDGLVDGGLEDGELDDEDRAALNAHLAEQSQYVTEIGARLFSEDGKREAQEEAKPSLWWNKSIEPLYHAGRLSADRNGLYEWVIGPTDQHCETCLSASGQRHRLKDWSRTGIIPRADVLLCGGFQCACSLVKTTGKARGRLAAIPRHRGD